MTREDILNMVKEYYKQNHIPKEYELGDKISYAKRVYDENEMVALVDSALEFWLTSGPYTKEFEEKLADYLSLPYCLFVNSGSSANLLAFMALTSPLLKERAIKRGDEVITVAAAFPTTVAPIVQYGAIPVFVDVTIPEYNIDTTKLESALTNKTKAVFIAHTLGNPFDIDKVQNFCKANNLWLVEDNCDSLGSKYDGKLTGTFGDIGTSSFYPPHHMTTGEGGAVYTSNPLLHKILLSMRDWGRDCICPSGVDNFCGHRFEKQYGELPTGYDHKYVYSHFGYNLKATDMQAAIGVAQLDKLNGFVQKRQQNFEYLHNKLKPAEDILILPKALEKSEPSWFGFLITLKHGKREDFVQYLEKNNIQTRLLFSGNIICHPCFDEMRIKNEGYRVVGNLDNTNHIMNNSFWIGVYPGMTEQMLDFMADTILNYCKTI